MNSSFLHRLVTSRALSVALKLGALALFPVAAFAQITFTISATANGSGLGYTNGQSATFTYVLDNFSPTAPNGTATASSSYVWSEELLTQPEIWTSVSGTGLAGSWTRPNASNGSPLSALEVHSDNSLKLYASEDTGSTGLTVNGQPVLAVSLFGTFTGLTFSPITGTLPDPTNYFSGRLGTYAANTTFDAKVWDTTNANVSFTMTSLTISAVPEPSTYATFAGLGALALAGWRRRGSVRRA